ncbi:MAG TPA: hypothetical protein PK438_05085 [Clostridia bacterium]|nr:hypothetical protein [Clostridia bacterium]
MKKLLAVLLCAALALSLTGCMMLANLVGGLLDGGGKDGPTSAPGTAGGGVATPAPPAPAETAAPQTAAPVAAPVDFLETMTLEMDLNGDGLIERVGFEEQYDGEDYVNYTTLRVTSDDGSDASADLEIMGGISAAYAYDIDGDGLVELFVSGDICSNDYDTWLFRYDAGALTAGDPAYIPDYEYDYVFPTVFGSVDRIEGGAVTICNTVDILGSWWCTAQYRMKAGGFGLERTPGSVWIYDSSDYTAEDWDWSAITAAEFPVTLDGANAPTTLPVGTRLVPLDTDGETYMHFITEDGTTGTILLARNSDPDTWGFTIDGVPEDELFSNLPYAG